MTVKKKLKQITAKLAMPPPHKKLRVVTSGSTKYAATEDDIAIKRPIQRRNVYKDGDKRHRTLDKTRGSVDRKSLRVDHNSYDTPDGNLVAKSAPGSGRTSPTDLLTLSLTAPKSWTPTNMANPPIEAKVVILGAQGVGKTSIVLRYVGKVFSNRVNSTIGASFFTFTMDVDNTKVKIQLWDTAGQERFRSMAPMYYRKANAAIIVYDITNSKSFEQAKEWVAELHKNIGTNIALCVVGNKIDLPKELRAVSTEKGKDFARSLNALFAETSAAHDIGVKDMFTQVAMRVVELSKYEYQDSRMSSYTSSHMMTSHDFDHHHQHHQHHQDKQEEESPKQSNPTTPNIVLTAEDEANKKKGWCCWR